MLDHLQYSEGLGAIYPAMMYAIMAMDALGYERDHPDLETAPEAIRRFDSRRRRQPDFSAGEVSGVGYGDRGICDGRASGKRRGERASAEVVEAQRLALTRASDWLLTKANSPER